MDRKYKDLRNRMRNLDRKFAKKGRELENKLLKLK